MHWHGYFGVSVTWNVVAPADAQNAEPVCLEQLDDLFAVRTIIVLYKVYF